MSTTLAPFLPRPFTSLIEQRAPGSRQNPQGFTAFFKAKSCKMCIAMCWTSFEGCVTDKGKVGHCGHRHSWCIVPCGEPLSSQIKQASSKNQDLNASTVLINTRCSPFSVRYGNESAQGMFGRQSISFLNFSYNNL